MDGAVQTISCDDGTTIEVRRLSNVMGAEVVGADLSKPLTRTLKAAILHAFLEHHLLAFRDQNLSPEQQHAFTTNFGEIEEHVARLPDGEKLPLVHVVNNLDKDGNPTAQPHSTGNYSWHTDKSYHAVPSLATLLHALELPPDGGDTLFVNTYLAYETLAQDRKEQMADLRAIVGKQAAATPGTSRPLNSKNASARRSATRLCARIRKPAASFSTSEFTHHTLKACRKLKAKRYWMN
jgi:alpha-ketoglutarate-dependent taurine dioxygenase